MLVRDLKLVRDTLIEVHICRHVSHSLYALLGRQAAEESLDEVMNAVGDSHMVFITAGECSTRS